MAVATIVAPPGALSSGTQASSSAFEPGRPSSSRYSACTKCSWRDEDAEITLIEARAWEHLQTHPADDEETT